MASINVSTLTDSVYDPNETFSLVLTGVTGGATIGTGSATTTIFQPGPPPQGPVPGSLILDPVGTINEGQSFTLTGRITPPGTYHLSSVQYNWGGFVTGSGGPASFSTNSSGGFSISNVYFDDGTSPGNGTASDVANISMTASVTGVQLTATTTATVVNVLPTTIDPNTGLDTMRLQPEELPGGPYFTLRGMISDAGLSDVHTITIDWGDETPPEVFTQQLGSFARDHRYPPTGETFIVTVTIADDDLGVLTWSDDAPMYLLDIDNDSDNNGAIEAVDEVIEAMYPGALVGVNGDDDNENTIIDMNDAGPVSGENDLEEFVLRWAPANRPDAGNYQNWLVGLYLTPAYGFHIPTQTWNPTTAAIYENADKTNPVPFIGGFPIPNGPAAVWSAASAFTKTLYLEARAAGQIQMELRPISPNGYYVDEDKVVFTAVEKKEVDLQIWHGQNAPDASGNGFLPEGKGDGKEEFDANQGDFGRGGAFTLANKNDTDNDGRLDKDDTYVVSAQTTVTAGVAAGVTVIPVVSTDGFAVGDGIQIVLLNHKWYRRVITAIDSTLKTITIGDPLDVALEVGALITHGGRSEVDLMPLRIVVRGFGGEPPGNVVIQASGATVKFWDKSYKGTEFVPDAEGKIALPAALAADGSLRLIWVELISESTSLGDVRITATYAGKTDFVEATGVWVNLQDVEHDKVSDVWADAPIGLFNETPPFGLIPRHPLGPGLADVFLNGIGFQFIAVPRGIYDQPIVKVDATRQKERGEWRKAAAGDDFTYTFIPFPWEAERANDDESATDETTSLNEKDQLYAYDTPGLGVEAVHEKSYAGNFYEWVRVSFGPNRPQGNEVLGSRATVYNPWTCSHRLLFISGALRRSTDDDLESADNNIKTGFKSPLTRPGS